MATYLVTGSNRGIGLEYCRQLKQRGDDVIATCRSSSSDLECLDVRIEAGVDVTSEASVNQLKKSLNGVDIDVLILNAAIAESISLENIKLDSLRRQFEVNAISPLIFTKAMLSKLREGSKVVFIAHIFTKNYVPDPSKNHQNRENQRKCSDFAREKQQRHI